MLLVWKKVLKRVYCLWFIVCGLLFVVYCLWFIVCGFRVIADPSRTGVEIA